MSHGYYINRLYKSPGGRFLRSLLRPAKHFLFGRSGIYYVSGRVAELAGGADKVGVILDIGAATGEYTKYLLDYFPKATVYAFEPLPESFDKLRRATAPYGDRVSVFNFGIYDGNSEKDLYVHTYRDASSLVNKDGQTEARIKIKLCRLDDVLEDLDLTKIDLAKIDVEGAEEEVVAGGEKSFAGRIDNVFMEILPQFKGYYSGSIIRIMERMHKYGFGFEGNYGDYFFSRLLPK